MTWVQVLKSPPGILKSGCRNPLDRTVRTDCKRRAGTLYPDGGTWVRKIRRRMRRCCCWMRYSDLIRWMLPFQKITLEVPVKGFHFTKLLEPLNRTRLSDFRSGIEDRFGRCRNPGESVHDRSNWLWAQRFGVESVHHSKQPAAPDTDSVDW